MSLFLYNRHRRSGAIAKLSPSSLVTVSTLPDGSLGKWTHVVRRGDHLLFYDRARRAGAIGVLQSNGIETISSYGPGTFGSWTHIVAAGSGFLFYDEDTGGGAFAVVGDVVTTTQSYAPGSFGRWTHVVSNGEAGSTLFFYNRLSGAAAIAETTSKSVRTTKVYAPGELGEWTHVVSCGSALLFSNRDTGAGVTATLTPSGIATTGSWGAGSFAEWTHIVTDNSTVLFMNRNTHDGAIGTLDASGFTTTHQATVGEWTNLAGSSSCGQERDEVRIEVLLAHWPEERPDGCLPVDFYRRYFFDLSYEDGIGRYWFIESGGALRLTGHVHDWTLLPRGPHTEGMKGRQAQATAAMTTAAAAGWKPGKADAVVAVVAAPAANGIDAGAVGAPLHHGGQTLSAAVILGNSSDWVELKRGLACFRFDFNAHEMGHVIGDQFAFNHAFGPGGAYDNPYCIMSAMAYGLQQGSHLGFDPTYDYWHAPSKGATPELLEVKTKGPGLAGTTRAACGWARTVRVVDAQLDDHGVVVQLAHLGDAGSTDVQVVEYKRPGSNPEEIYTIEFRSPLAEHDQAYPPTIVCCRRGGRTWSTDATWAVKSSIFVDAMPTSTAGKLPSLHVADLFHVQVLSVGPQVLSPNGPSAPAWVRVRVLRRAPVGLDTLDPETPVTRIHPRDWDPPLPGTIWDS